VLTKAAQVVPVDRNAKRAEIQQALKIPATSILIAAAAELTPATRCKDLIWAIDLLCCVRDDVHLLLLGDGAQRWRLNRFLDSTEAQGHVHFLGRPPDADQIVAAADIFWQADLTQAMSDGALLAMAAHVPLVCALGTTTNGFARHQQTAFAVKYKSRDQFARWTKFLLEQNDRAELMAKQARQFVQENFPLERMIRQFESIYDSI
jgi:glycosyltransferase involved in cell wall biosynthesis